MIINVHAFGPGIYEDRENRIAAEARHAAELSEIAAFDNLLLPLIEAPQTSLAELSAVEESETFDNPLRPLIEARQTPSHDLARRTALTQPASGSNNSKRESNLHMLQESLATARTLQQETCLFVEAILHDYNDELEEMLEHALQDKSNHASLTQALKCTFNLQIEQLGDEYTKLKKKYSAIRGTPVALAHYRENQRAVELLENAWHALGNPESLPYYTYEKSEGSCCCTIL